MTNLRHHPSDEDLLLGAEAVSDFLRPRVRVHLDSCDRCRQRLVELNDALCAFSHAHRNSRHHDLPSADRSRRSLQLRLAELAADQKHTHSFWSRSFPYRPALAALALSACLVLAFGLRRAGRKPAATLASVVSQEEPDFRLTPGATIPVSQKDICGAASGSLHSIPVSLKQQVFQLYKVSRPPDQFEVDYLITPELGGATDIRNLWPEPYYDTVWNARVKDQLEERLHQMVCRGDLDLATAQRDISTDWIAAYRRYFHSDRPLADRPAANPALQKDLTGV